MASARGKLLAVGTDKEPDDVAAAAPQAPRTFAAVIRRDFRTRQLDCHPFAQRGELIAPPPAPTLRNLTPLVADLPEPTMVTTPPRRVAHTVARPRKARPASSSGEHVLELSIDDSDRD